MVAFVAGHDFGDFLFLTPFLPLLPSGWDALRQGWLLGTLEVQVLLMHRQTHGARRMQYPSALTVSFSSASAVTARMTGTRGPEPVSTCIFPERPTSIN